MSSRRSRGAGARLLRAAAVIVVGPLLLAAGLGGLVLAAGRIGPLASLLSGGGVPATPFQPQTTLLFDRRGHLLAPLSDGQDRTSVPLSEIAVPMRQATVAVEDHNFFHEGGISLSGTVRAAVTDLLSHQLVEGGSTITQQYVKLMYTGDARTLGRKLREAVLAERLAHELPKGQILDDYLNTVYFGEGAYGVQVAAETYFGIPASALDLTQASLLAGLIQAPTDDDPVHHPAAARARRAEVLAAMVRQNELAPLRAAAVERSPLGVRLHPIGPTRDGALAPDFVAAATAALRHRYGERATFGGGLRVTTTLDSRMQAAAEEAVASHLSTPGDPAAALVAIDPTTGAVRAMVGGGHGVSAFNLATRAVRQEGSAFKTFTLVAALEQGIPLSSVWDGPPQLAIADPRCRDGAGQPWQVSNYADESAGTMTLAEATANSVNTIFAQLVVKVGPEEVARVAREMGITRPLQPVCSITLGSQGATPLEMTDAYATLADGGIRHPPRELVAVRDAAGRTLAEPGGEGDRALPADVAAEATSALQGVVQSGTGTAANTGRPEAGKTGTGQDYRDAWFCGYVPQLAACVWVGYPQGEIPMHDVEGYPDVFGGSIPALIWHDFMASALTGVPVEPFPVPATGAVLAGP